MGYGSGVKGYRLYDPESHKVIHSRNVTFNENAMLSSVKDTVISSTDTGDQEYAREKVEFEIKTPTHEKTFPIPPVLKIIKSLLLMVQVNI